MGRGTRPSSSHRTGVRGSQQCRVGADERKPLFPSAWDLRNSTPREVAPVGTDGSVEGGPSQGTCATCSCSLLFWTSESGCQAHGAQAGIRQSDAALPAGAGARCTLGYRPPPPARLQSAGRTCGTGGGAWKVARARHHRRPEEAPPRPARANRRPAPGRIPAPGP